MIIKLKGFSPEETKDVIHKELSLFMENWELLLENFSKILSCGEYFHCKLSFAYINTIYFGGGYIPLGVLLLGWEEDVLKERCPECRQESWWITGFGGGLSIGWKWGVCVNCKNYVKTSRGSSDYVDIWRNILPMIRAFPSYGMVEVEKDVPQFSWLKGVTHKRKKVKERIGFYNTVSFEELVREIREGKERKCKELIYSFSNIPKLKDIVFKNRGW